MSSSFQKIVYGVVAILIAIILFGIIVTQLDTAMTTANSTTNTMTGLYDVMGIWGIVLWLAIVGSGMGLIVSGAVEGIRSKGGGYRRRRRR